MAGRRTFISDIPRTAKRKAPPSLRPIAASDVTVGMIAELLMSVPRRPARADADREGAA
jgi:hypothetical protein